MAKTTKKAEVAAKPKKTVVEKPVVEKAKVAPVTTKAATGIAIVAPVSREEIAKLAHRYWVERGHKHGQHVDDWFRAEQELRNKAS